MSGQLVPTNNGEQKQLIISSATVRGDTDRKVQTGKGNGRRSRWTFSLILAHSLGEFAPWRTPYIIMLEGAIGEERK